MARVALVTAAYWYCCCEMLAEIKDKEDELVNVSGLYKDWWTRICSYQSSAILHSGRYQDSKTLHLPLCDKHYINIIR